MEQAMRRFRSLYVGPVVTCALTCQCLAQVVAFDNFLEDPPYPPSRGFRSPPASPTTWGLAYRFSPFASGTITGIDAGIFTHLADHAGAAITMSLLSEVGGWPSEPIGSMTFEIPHASPGSPTAPYRITPSEPIAIEAGSWYWLAITGTQDDVPGQMVAWYHGDESVDAWGRFATLHQFPHGLEWGASDVSVPQGGFRVLVPAPVGGAALGALLLMTGARRRR